MSIEGPFKILARLGAATSAAIQNLLKLQFGAMKTLLNINQWTESRLSSHFILTFDLLKDC